MATVKTQYANLLHMTEQQNGSLARIESVLSDPSDGIHVRVDRLAQSAGVWRWWGRAVANTAIVTAVGGAMLWLGTKIAALIHVLNRRD